MYLHTSAGPPVAVCSLAALLKQRPLERARPRPPRLARLASNPLLGPANQRPRQRPLFHSLAVGRGASGLQGSLSLSE